MIAVENICICLVLFPQHCYCLSFQISIAHILATSGGWYSWNHYNVMGAVTIGGAGSGFPQWIQGMYFLKSTLFTNAKLLKLSHFVKGEPIESWRKTNTSTHNIGMIVYIVLLCGIKLRGEGNPCSRDLCQEIYLINPWSSARISQFSSQKGPFLPKLMMLLHGNGSSQVGVGSELGFPWKAARK
jgi:hypothetical protein